MQAIGFVGSSGTGKSYRAFHVAHDEGICHIIDDGLLISNSNILAGFSAKREPTRIAAVRRALFFDEAHATEVRAALTAAAPEKILILGTSVAMIEKIAQALCIDPPVRYISIEDIATPEEIEKAKNVRLGEGKHVIPVPTFEVRRAFSGYFLDALSLFKRKKTDVAFERTIVRPTFSYMGEFIISESAIVAICTHAASKVPGVERILHVGIRHSDVGASFDMELAVKYGIDIKAAAKAVINEVRSAVEKLTEINVLAVDVYVRTLVLS